MAVLRREQLSFDVFIEARARNALCCRLNSFIVTLSTCSCTRAISAVIYGQLLTGEWPINDIDKQVMGIVMGIDCL